jgi:hypothetical protein
VPGDSGGPRASSAGVIGMDTVGNDASSQQAAAGFAIPINRRCRSPGRSPGATPAPSSRSATRRSWGSFAGSGPSSSPQAQAQQEGQQNGGGGSTRAYYTSNSDLIVPSTIAPVNSGTLIIGTICGAPRPRPE